MDEAELVVVGGGPAGLAAAIVTAEHGADVLVVDEQHALGGQIYRQPPASFRVATRAGADLLQRAESAPFRTRFGTTAWGVFGTTTTLDSFGSLDGDVPDGCVVVALAEADGIDRVAARRLLIAPGAYDLPVPFPGWTLPGVMAAGGVQAFVKSQRFLPGRRFVLAGAHPLLLVIAEQLEHEGAELAAVALAQPRPAVLESLRDLPRLRSDAARLLDLVRGLRTLRRRSVPLLFSHVIARAEGDRELEAVQLAAVDAAWRVGEPTTRLECDTLAVGYGFVASSELARQAGCAVRYDSSGGGWVVVHDRWMRTSIPSIFVAGEITGIAGADQAYEEGQLAALGVLRDLGRLRADEAERLAGPVRRRLQARARFATIVRRRFAPRHHALVALADDETLVCRCEEISAGALRAALREHPHLATADAVKLLTRTGMGPCQGRLCMHAVAELTAAARGRTPAEVGPYTARPPTKPIRLGALADAAAPG